MNGFSDKGFDESNFGGDSSSALNTVKAFDAFPKTKPSYTQKTHNGGVWTIFLICASVWLTFSELKRWWVGETTHNFSVEQGVGHDLQINLDVIVAMNCADVHVNVQDASGDRILAGQKLTRDGTTWAQWGAARGRSHALGQSIDSQEYREEDVHDYLGATRSSKKFKKTPRVPSGKQPDSCRVYGSIEGNKVQGDFHITARGHGYMEFGQHLDHDAFNFSHHINELSFGPFYPTLVNPLDQTFATTEEHFYKFQYYLSVVPTIYTTDIRSLNAIDKYHESPSSGQDGLQQQLSRYMKNTVFTNQYAVTEQSHPVSEAMVPGIFVKFDIEPILLTIAEEWSSVPALLIRLVNLVSGVLVAGGWCYQLSEWVKDARGLRRRRASTMGMLNGGMDEKRGL